MIVYQVVKYDCNTKRCQSIQEYTDLYNALNASYAYVINYIQINDGYEKIKNDHVSNFIFNKKNFRSAIKNSLPIGYYIVRDVDHVYKFEVWRKSLKNIDGWFGTYKGDDWAKVFDIDIVENKINYITIDESLNNDVSVELKSFNKNLLNHPMFLELNDAANKNNSVKDIMKKYITKKNNKNIITYNITVKKNNDEQDLAIL